LRRRKKTETNPIESVGGRANKQIGGDPKRKKKKGKKIEN
jgi:hypothetical protein